MFASSLCFVSIAFLRPFVAQADADYIVALKVKAKQLQFERYAASIKFAECPVFRNPERFASSKFTARGKDKLRAAMLTHSKARPSLLPEILK